MFFKRNNCFKFYYFEVILLDTYSSMITIQVECLKSLNLDSNMVQEKILWNVRKCQRDVTVENPTPNAL